ncbi:PDR/VanB family oxidoreductase [Specibacter cremeus]|uniref:PDR/VanB family oxidoreductase n=1 Tax=Specibacter cremeus TaxID=1629051 RepID=UPI000F77D1F4|nr:PDR/VanB family oxidoreductase [Specibacter cremeus]
MTTLQSEPDLALLSVPEDSAPGATLEVRVLAARREAEAVTSFEFARPGGGLLPAWAPGAHIDVHLPSGTVRQYSLCGDPADTGTYRIAVLELPAGRGGSVEAHRELRPGQTLRIGLPRENFGLAEAERYVFMAGGIGITPLLPMIREVARRGRPWRLVYGARSADHFAFLPELHGIDGASGRASVELVAQDTDGHPDLAAIVAGSDGAAVYCCGPGGLMDALADQMDRAGRLPDLHLERFAPAAPAVRSNDDGGSGSGASVADGAFQVELGRSGLVVDVAAGVTILEAVRAAGVDHPSSCEMGFCGTCEAKVISGEVDHRDDLLTEQERAAGTCMMLCVSRAKCARLVLDL